MWFNRPDPLIIPLATIPFYVIIVLSLRSESSSYFIWNATSFEETPLFSSELPQRVPYGVHGIWFPPQNIK